MTLSAFEFIRRFALHILPSRFVRIRHYGFLASRFKQRHLQIIRQQLQVGQQKAPALDWKTACKDLLNFDPESCPHCGGQMLTISFLPPARAPPLPYTSLKS